MSSRQWKRWDGVERVRVGLMTNAEAALGLSARQMRATLPLRQETSRMAEERYDVA